MNLKSLKYYDEFFICAYCAYCVDNKAACPTFLSSHHEIVTGRGKMITARNLAQGYIKKEEAITDCLPWAESFWIRGLNHRCYMALPG